VVLQGVTPGSPAAKVGIEVGDQITAGGPTAEALIPVRNHSEFKHILGPADAGGRIVLEVERGGEKRRVECELVKELPSYREPYLGILIEPGTESKSPLVRGVIPESPAQRAGIEVGERIELIGGQGITEDRSLDVRLGNLNYREAVPVVLKRGDGTTRELSVALVAHPENDIEWEDRLEVPAVGEEGEVKGVQVGVGTVQLPLGDVKNKAFAIVPSTYREEVAHGLLVIYADAGEQDQKQWSEAWEAFAREHRWIVAVAQSAGETGWTFEELEIGNRVQNWVTSTYSIDRRRIVSGGIGSGSLLAYITAAQTPELFRGVWLCNGKLTARVRVLPSEPFKAAHYFVNGTDKGVEAFVERLRQNGYSVQSSSSDLESSKLVESPLLGPLQRWMRLLEAY
jgi:hypothetical protein